MVTELADGVWWYDFRGVNAYLVDDGGTLTLVDSGTPLARRRLILGLDEAGYDPSDVDRVLLTHYDPDHVGGIGRLDWLDTTVYVGSLDRPLVTGEQRPSVRSRKGLVQRFSGPLLSAPSADVEAVEDGDTVGSFTVYHTPGHTRGHVCYISESLSVAFLGDLVREEDGRLEPSPWVLSEDRTQVEESIRRLAEEAPPFEVAAMGHGVPFVENGSERLAELVDRL
jgi:glyoxylase-like metal-dependent hydrolase (beta-lactamase superfamily II)